MAQIAYVDWDGLVYYDGKIKDYISNNLEDTLKDGGQVLYSELPSPTRNTVNYVYTVTENFTRTQELFGVNGGTYNAGTAVKVTEVTPGQYLYTILNETRNPSDVETFDDIYAQIKELKDEIDSFNPESSDYYNKAEINELFAKVNLELDRQDKRIDKLAEDQSEDHRTLCELIATGGAGGNLNNYYTKEEADNKFATFDDIASNILFADKKYKVTNTVGGFRNGEVITNMSISDMFTTLLGLQEYTEPVIPDEPIIPDNPDSVITDIIENDRTIYHLDSNNQLEEIPFKVITIIDPEADITDKEEGFYQIIDNGEMKEAGYQVVSPDASISMVYYIALPNTIVFGENAEVTYYSALSSPKWVTNPDMIVTKDLNKLVEIHGGDAEPIIAELQTIINTLPDNYDLWLIDAEEISSGKSYRFVIKEDI